MEFNIRSRRAEIDALIVQDAASYWDYLLRCLIVGIVGTMVWAFTGLGVALLWCVVFATVNGGYAIYVRRLQPPVGFAAFLTVIGANYFIATWFVSLPLYGAVLGGPVFPILGLFGVAGLGFYNLSRHSTFNLVITWSITLTVCSLLLLTYFFASSQNSWGGSLAVGITGGGVAGYYLMAHIKVLRIGARLARSEQRERAHQRSLAVGQLTTGIAHEFNNILTVIRGNLDLFEALDDPQEQHAALEDARKSSERAAALVAQLLASSGKSTMVRAPVDLAEYFGDRQRDNRSNIPRHIALTVNVPPPGTVVMVDRDLLDIALDHALDNACRALVDEGGTITLGAQKADETPGDWVRIYIHDSGPGVRPEIMDRLTEPFFTTRQVGEGAGLGLAALKGFAKQSGGWLELENRPDGGFGLYILLPQAEAAVAEIKSAEGGLGSYQRG